MSAFFKVHFLFPDSYIVFDMVISLSINGFRGKLMILAHHSPYLIYLSPGFITIKMNNQKKEEKILIKSGGMLEVFSNICYIIAN